MSLINFILDIAGLLLWFSWRSIPFDPLTRATPATLAGTVRRAEPTRLKRWHFLAALVGLLFVRAFCYWQVGRAVNWTPRLDLGIVAPAFRGNVFVTALLFSVSSFVRTWIIFHFWLLAIAFVNSGATERDPIQKMILLQLGAVGRWPRMVLVVLPAMVVALVWIAGYPLLVRAGVINAVQFPAHLLGQGAALGAAVYFTLKDLVPVLLFLHLIVSYVYLGGSPFWDFVNTTSRRILRPLDRMPLRFGKIDFAPLVGIVITLLVLHVLPNLVLNQFSRKHLTLWPQ